MEENMIALSVMLNSFLGSKPKDEPEDEPIATTEGEVIELRRLEEYR